MLKETIQSLMKDKGEWFRIQSGQLQLAGLTDTEHRALRDVLQGNDKEDNNQFILWC